MGRKKKGNKKGVEIGQLHFYFDGVARDRLDAGSISRKSGEILRLREKIL